jgi:protocatechuate 3,4-dioxygenase beta subunit
MNVHRLAIVLLVLLTATGTAAAVVPAGGADERASTTSERTPVTLTVTVTDNFNEGIRNAKVTAHWDGGSESGETKSNGQVLLDVPDSATVRLFVNHSSYTLNNPVVVEDAASEAVQIEVFRKADAAVTVRSDGTTIEDATVTLTKTDESRAAASGTTGSNGVFESGTIEKGTYTVSVVKPGFERNETTVDVRGTTSTQVIIESATATITFSTVDDHFDEPKPLEGATIEIRGATNANLPTTSNGKASIGLPVNADYTVAVTKDGYETAERTISVGEADKSVSFTLNREPSLSVEAVNERVVVGENVQVTVTDEYGDRVADATVEVDGETVGTTDAEGVYRATIESGGEHTITVRNDGVSGSVTVEGVSPGDGGTSTATATGTATGTSAPIGDLSQPSLVMKVGVAAVGVLLAFLVVRRLL